jgi:glucose-6-phosphate 1-dehydrogenase
MSSSTETAHPLPPTILVIFGGGGDLTWRKLTPALFDLYLDHSMPDQFAAIVVDRVELSAEKLHKRLHDGVAKFSRQGKPAADQWKPFAERFSYLAGDFKDAQTYTQLKKQIEAVEGQWQCQAQRVFYMATPPAMFNVIPERIAAAKLASDVARSRLVVEKPIGSDLASAQSLNRYLAGSFDESQLFRIDHYLGKETVQNILAFRFANPQFEPIWDRRYVDHVAITVAEQVGVEHRGGYYEHAGAVRDMVQNHLMQLLCLVAMEPMVSFDADELRNKKVDVLHAIRPIPHASVHDFAVRGQYGEGWIEGKQVCAYCQEPDVAKHSNTPTFAALKLFIDNWRWQDVPFYLRTGKRLMQQVSEISIQFRPVPHQAFPAQAALDWRPARLTISIQPVEGIVLTFQAKHPGRTMHLWPVEMRFNYRQAFDVPSPDAYETLLWDVMAGDGTLFMRADQIEAAWTAVMPILDVWSASAPTDFPNYHAGTWGPQAAAGLLAHSGHTWQEPASPTDA